MHPHAELIDRLYRALAARDWATMARCYHPQAHFGDEVFDLAGDDIAAMWRMLCTNGRAHWDARYTFAATGRQVLNRIDASFGFRDGLIVRHVDRFDFWAWSRQALGAPGWLLGWTGFLRRKVRSQAARNLAGFKARIAAG
jgi:hypothetical protein